MVFDSRVPDPAVKVANPIPMLAGNRGPSAIGRAPETEVAGSMLEPGLADGRVTLHGVNRNAAVCHEGEGLEGIKSTGEPGFSWRNGANPAGRAALD